MNTFIDLLFLVLTATAAVSVMLFAADWRDTGRA
jgi:hypothetical protein